MVVRVVVVASIGDMGSGVWSVEDWWAEKPWEEEGRGRIIWSNTFKFVLAP